MLRKRPFLTASFAIKMSVIFLFFLELKNRILGTRNMETHQLPLVLARKIIKKIMTLFFNEALEENPTSSWCLYSKLIVKKWLRD
jgi:hypothetical protein